MGAHACVVCGVCVYVYVRACVRVHVRACVRVHVCVCGLVDAKAEQGTGRAIWESVREGLVKGGQSELEASAILICRRPLLQRRWQRLHQLADPGPGCTRLVPCTAERRLLALNMLCLVRWPTDKEIHTWTSRCACVFVDKCVCVCVCVCEGACMHVSVHASGCVSLCRSCRSLLFLFPLLPCLLVGGSHSVHVFGASPPPPPLCM